MTLFTGVEELRFLFCLKVLLIKITYILVKFKQIESIFINI